LRILISGISGFIGSHLERFQQTAGHTIFGLSRSNSQQEWQTFAWPENDGGLANILEKVRPDIIVHAAGNSFPQLSLTEPERDFEANVGTTFRLLEAMRSVKLNARLVLLSSAAVYGEPDQLPIRESTEIKPMTPYGRHKYRAEEICREYGDNGIDWTGLRIFSAYGAGLRRQVIYDCTVRALSGSDLSLKGTGRETRDFIHIDDVVQGIALVSTHRDASGRVFNLASGEETPISDIGRLILQALDMHSEFHFEGSPQAGLPVRWCADISAIRSIGFDPTKKLGEGVQDTVRWIRESKA
jgi:UDP-glucose 4-epimerase